VPVDRKCLAFEIDRIAEAGMPFDRQVDCKLFDIDDEDVSLKQDVTLKGALNRAGKDITVSVRIGTAASVKCSRCLKSFPQIVDCAAKAHFKPFEEEIFGGDEVELNARDCETEYYKGSSISLAEIVRDAILLSFPANVLCKEDCRGLCSQCGADLNLKDCDCDKDNAVDPRLEKLRILKEKL